MYQGRDPSTGQAGGSRAEHSSVRPLSARSTSSMPNRNKEDPRDVKLPNLKKKYVAGALAAGLIMGAGGIAAAYFGVTGSGTGTAATGHATNVTIEGVGAGYNSIVLPSTPDPYVDSECMNGCSGVLELGNAIKLATSKSYAELTSVTVALVNLGSAGNTTVTMKLTDGPNGPYTFTVTATVAAGTSPTPKVTDVTFTFANEGVFVYKTFQYGLSITQASTVRGVNIGMAKDSEVSVGSNQTTDTVWVSTTSEPTFHTRTGNFTTINTLTPAVRFNMVGGLVGPLYPGAPATHVEYAVTNPGATGAHLTTVKTALGTLPTGCASTWFQIYGTQPHTVDTTFPPGLTVVTNTGTTIAMLTKPVTQDTCANASIPLTFTGTH